MAFYKWSRDDASIAGVYVLEPDGTQRRLLDFSLYYFDWSPDHQWLLFPGGHEGQPDLYLVSADGTTSRRLTNDPYGEGTARWSRDGTEILFASERDWPGGSANDIYSLEVATGAIRRLTADQAIDVFPTVSADGTTIVFTSNRDGVDALYAMNRDGSNLRRIGPVWTDRNIAFPTFSPDGSRIAFQAAPLASDQSFGPDAQIYVMNADGTGVRQLTSNAISSIDPCWSPDGRYVAFHREDYADHNIYAVEVETGIETPILKTFLLYESSPAWGTR